jgi:hypothetical protein
MNTQGNWLFIGGVLSAAAALAHLACIFGGADWYRFFGAGERMARLVERQSIKPTLITLAITGMLAVCSVYALSGAGVIGRLPFLRPVLIAITTVYLLRAAAFPMMVRMMPDRSAPFLVWSSVIVLVFGIVHAIGLINSWQYLA